MKVLRILFALFVCIKLFSVSINAQDDSQAKFNSITPRFSNIRYIENILGKTDSKKLLHQWKGKLKSDGAFEGIYDSDLNTCRDDIKDDLVTRNIYTIDYPKIGLSVKIFDNPWLVLSISATSKKISLFGIKVGDDLNKVENALGKGEWSTTKKDNYWILEFEKKRVRFLFERDVNAPQFPLKLKAGEKIVKIEKFDEKALFTSCRDEPIPTINN